MSPTYLGVTRDARGFPRVSGDEPDYTIENLYTCMFSPRERG